MDKLTRDHIKAAMENILNYLKEYENEKDGYTAYVFKGKNKILELKNVTKTELSNQIKFSLKD